MTGRSDHLVIINLNEPGATQGERLAQAYRGKRVAWASAAFAGEPIEQLRIETVEAADALCVEVLNHPAQDEAVAWLLDRLMAFMEATKSAVGAGEIVAGLNQLLDLYNDTVDELAPIAAKLKSP